MTGIFSLPAFEASLWLSLYAAPIGCFLVFRRLSFFGDALSHATLAGVALALLIWKDSPLAILIGALVSVLLTAAMLRWFENKAKLPPDVALTVSYSGVFALGLLLLRSSDEEHAEHILFGDILQISSSMLWFHRLWAVVALLTIVYFWRPLWAFVTDGIFARSLGYRVGMLDALFLALTAVSVVGMIQSVGVILVAAYLILPAATALPWARSLVSLVGFSVLFALISSFCGLCIVAEWTEGILQKSPGPWMAFSAFLILVLSHLTRLLLNFVQRGSHDGSFSRTNRN